LSAVPVGEYKSEHDFEVEVDPCRSARQDDEVTSPQGIERLDPEFVAATPLYRVLLTDETLPVARRSLDERRAAFVAEFDTGRVIVESSTVELPDRTVDLRVYRGSPELQAPVLVFFHSGALVMGNLDTDHARCVAMARDAGCVVVSVDYRLAPEHAYPAALDDCVAVVRAVATEPERFGVDPGRLAIGGNSAGAGLTAAVALRLRDEGGPRPCFQLMHQPMLDSSCATPSMKEFVATPGFDSESARFSWDGYLRDQPVTAHASPSRAESLAGLPPAYICCSELDPLRDEAMEYARRLVEEGVPTELHLLAGTCHGFDSFAPAHALAVSALDEQSAALLRAFATALSAPPS
jgi:acetyl esterase/lipase